MLSEITTQPASSWDVETFIRAVISIFAIVNPVGNLPIFLGLTENAGPAERRRVFRLASIVALCIIVAMALGGKYLLHDVFNITFDEFRIGGGMLLIAIALVRILSRSDKRMPLAPQQAVQEQTRIAVSPIASPLLVGPGSIITVMLIANNQGVLYALAASAVCFVLVALILHYAELAFRIMGPVGSMALGRVMDIFIMAIGVHFIVQSLLVVFPGIAK